jgi:protein kinase-like protein
MTPLGLFRGMSITELLTELAGYELDEILGEGPTGRTYKATSSKRIGPAAIKVVSPDVLSEAGADRRFKVYADAAAGLHHDNIISVVDAGTVGPTAWIAYDFVRHETLAEVLDEQELGRLPWREAVHVLVSIGRGLAHVEEHRMPHGNVHLGNVGRTRDGRWLVADVGLPAPPTEARSTEVDGSAHCLAPEQARGEAVVPASTVFTLGVLLYRMVTGRMPAHGARRADVLHSIATVRPDKAYWIVSGLPKGLTRALERMMAYEPSKRYGSVAEVVAILEALPLDQHVPIAADRKRKQVGLSSIGFYAVLLVLLGGTAWFFRGALGQILDRFHQTTERVNTAAPDATGAASGSEGSLSSRALAAAAFDEIEARANELAPLSAETKTDWLEIAAAYEALLSEHDPVHICVQQAFLKARGIRREAAALGAADTGAEDLDDWIVDALSQLQVGAAEMPEDVPARMLDLPEAADLSPESLEVSLDRTFGVARVLMGKGRTRDALRTVLYWERHARRLATGRTELEPIFVRVSDWVRTTAVTRGRVMAAELASDDLVLVPAFGATRLLVDGRPRRDAGGLAQALERGARAMQRGAALVTSTPHVARMSERGRRLAAAARAFDVLLVALNDRLLEDGAPLSDIGDGTPGTLDATQPFTRDGLSVRAKGAEASHRVSWEDVPGRVIAESVVLPFLATLPDAERQGAFWLLLELEAPDVVEDAVPLALGALQSSTIATLQREAAAQRAILEKDASALDAGLAADFSLVADPVGAATAASPFPEERLTRWYRTFGEE